jgi:class 3 adenylate cyclase
VTPESIQTQLVKLKASVAGLEAQQDRLDEGILRPALDSLREKIAALQAQLDAPSNLPEERRIVTVLFGDIVGSTALASGMDPEDWHAVLQDVLRLAGALIEGQGGRVVQYQGDGILALFGTRQMSEQDAEHAVQAGLALQTALTERAGPPLQMRVGIHTGLVLQGEVGTDIHRAYTATGDAMNLAARLQAAAPPGGVLISHATYRQVRGLFEVCKQRLITVKGKIEPLQTYLVTAANPRPFLVGARGVPGLKAPTVGRATEWARLQAELEQVHTHGGLHWTQLIGPPGIGKSRLLAEAGALLESRADFHVLRARASQGDEHQAFALVRRLWFDRFQIAEDATLSEAETHWMEQFTALYGPGCEEPAQVLGILTGLPFHSSPYIGVLRDDPVQFKARAVVVSRQLLARLCLSKPVVILLEDLHWEIGRAHV